MKLSSPSIGEEEILEIRKVLATGNISGTSPVVKEFEEDLKKYVGVNNVIACSSCTAALHLACLSIGLRFRDEVIVASYSFPASGFAPMYCQARPVLCDIEKSTFNIDPEEIEELITEKTKAIIPVDTFGNPVDIKRINEIAEEHDLKVVEDAACAIDSKINGKYCGTEADIGCYSFYAIKTITTGGEGGCCLTNNGEYAAKIRSLADFGKTKPLKSFFQVGYNYRLSGVSAAIGIAQLRKLPSFTKKKNKLVSYYKKRLEEEGMDWIHPQEQLSHTQHSWQRFTCLLDKEINRDEMISALGQGGIEANIGTYDLSSQPVFLSNIKPNSFFVSQHSVSLPLYYEMPFADVDYVIEKLVEFYKGYLL